MSYHIGLVFKNSEMSIDQFVCNVLTFHKIFKLQIFKKGGLPGPNAC